MKLVIKKIHREPILQEKGSVYMHHDSLHKARMDNYILKGKTEHTGEIFLVLFALFLVEGT